MKFLIVTSVLLGLASAGIVYPGTGPDAAYGSASSSGSDGYGTQTETRCTPYFDTVQEDRCESYQERVCTTQQRESCNDVADQSCRAIVTTNQIRKCFDVTEILCSLKENVQLETVEVGFTVQKCQKLNERVCDTVYETNRNTREDVQCLNVDNPVCQNEERTIQDKTCRTTTQFDCTQTGGGYGSGNQGGNQGGNGGYSGSDNSGSEYGSSAASGYGSGSEYGSPAPAGYGSAPEPQVQCTRRQETKCYNTPRTVNVQRCQHQSEKVCERVVLVTPTVEERQNCRNEEKKVCQLEQRSQPKQVKKYNYNKQCRNVPRSVCENSDVKQLVPSCVASTRKECSYTPVENCEDIPKKHCFKVNKQIRRERCEQITVPATGGYPSGISGSSGYMNNNEY